MREQDNVEQLTQTISDIVKFTGKIGDMDFDEAATKQFVVLPILTALGWNYANNRHIGGFSRIPNWKWQ